MQINKLSRKLAMVYTILRLRFLSFYGSNFGTIVFFKANTNYNNEIVYC